jgi:hypothetical protein
MPILAFSLHSIFHSLNVLDNANDITQNLQNKVRNTWHLKISTR